MRDFLRGFVFFVGVVGLVIALAVGLNGFIGNPRPQIIVANCYEYGYWVLNYRDFWDGDRINSVKDSLWHPLDPNNCRIDTVTISKDVRRVWYDGEVINETILNETETVKKQGVAR